LVIAINTFCFIAGIAGGVVESLPKESEGEVRAIKFRAWDRTLKQMIFGSTSMVIRFSGKVTDGSTTPDVELMQFTGLHDKNGKEIYEGDILGSVGINASFAHAEVVFWGGCFYAKHRTAEKLARVLLDVADIAPIIGNVFENPELLEPAANDPKSGIETASKV